MVYMRDFCDVRGVSEVFCEVTVYLRYFVK